MHSKYNPYLKFTTNIGILLMLVVFLQSCKDKTESKYQQKKSATVVAHAKNTFVGAETCKTCHQQAYNSWKGSDHDLAMQIADSTTVLGNFKDAKFSAKGIHYHFFKKEGDFYVNTQGEGGVYKDYKIEFTFGVYPLQQYIIKFPKGKYQCLTAAWDAKNQKWYDLQPTLKPDHTEWMHWTGGSMTWNNMCADCHSTNLHKNYNSTSESYATKYSIINVSCEACHGPSSNHVEYYNTDTKEGTPPKMYMDKSTKGKALVQKCARCHSRRSQLTPYFNYEGHFLDHYNPSKMTPDIYELDGQIKDEDYVYGSFVQSKMYHEGVSCKDCHNTHTLKLKKEGNALCLQCHKPKYDSPKHHFHKNNTKASQCVNCHMTGKTYMGNDFRRDHSFRIPRPDQSEKYGTPNACIKCHTKKSNQWAKNAVIARYGNTRADHFSDHLLKGYYGDKKGFQETFTNPNYPEIIRATALSQYVTQPLSNQEIENVVSYLQDDSVLVRNEAALGLGEINVADFSEVLKPLLLDSVRLVRISAARYFNIKGKPLEATTKAQQDFETEQQINADFASGQHQIALVYQAKGNTEKAIEAYQKALKIDNYYNRSRINLALLEFQRGNTQKAATLYLKVTAQEPEYSYPYFMLGLLYNEIGNADKSLQYLKLATQKKPPIVRAFYNYALKLQQIDKYKQSLNVINEGLQQFPYHEQLLYLKVLAEIKLKQNSAAKNTCLLLLQIAPNNRNYQQIMAQFN